LEKWRFIHRERLFMESWMIVAMVAGFWAAFFAVYSLI
jgi:hypothetical protein